MYQTFMHPQLQQARECFGEYISRNLYRIPDYNSYIAWANSETGIAAINKLLIDQYGQNAVDPSNIPLLIDGYAENLVRQNTAQQRMPYSALPNAYGYGAMPPAMMPTQQGAYALRPMMPFHPNTTQQLPAGGLSSMISTATTANAAQRMNNRNNNQSMCTNTSQYVGSNDLYTKEQVDNLIADKIANIRKQYEDEIRKLKEALRMANISKGMTREFRPRGRDLFNKYTAATSNISWSIEFTGDLVKQPVDTFNKAELKGGTVLAKHIYSSEAAGEVETRNVEVSNPVVDMDKFVRSPIMQYNNTENIFANDIKFKSLEVLELPYNNTKNTINACAKYILNNGGKLDTIVISNINKTLATAGEVGLRLAEAILYLFNRASKVYLHYTRADGARVSMPELDNMEELNRVITGDVPEALQPILTHKNFSRNLILCLKASYGAIFANSKQAIMDISNYRTITNVLKQTDHVFENGDCGVDILLHRHNPDSPEAKERARLVDGYMQSITPLAITMHCIDTNMPDLTFPENDTACYMGSGYDQAIIADMLKNNASLLYDDYYKAWCICGIGLDDKILVRRI